MLVINELTISLELDHNDMAAVRGGILQKEGLYPRKPGDVEYEVYVDGMYWGTTYAGRDATITGNRTDRLI